MIHTRLLCYALMMAAPLSAQTRISDLATRSGEVPVRLVGYGLVVGLDQSGDRSFGTNAGAVHTVRSVTNLLRRFNVDVPAQHLRLRNVAAVVVTAEVSPFLRTGGRFDIQVASLGDATSLRGGVLWMTPLVMSPDAPPVASAQGPIPMTTEVRRVAFGSRGGGASARLTDGGILEADLPPVPAVAEPLLALRAPDLATAARIAAAVNAAYGDGVATVLDPGAVGLKPPAGSADNLPVFLAAVDTLEVTEGTAASRIVIDARSGLVAAGGDVTVGPVVVAVKGITVQIGGVPPADSAQAIPGMVTLSRGATVQDVAVGLQAVGAAPAEVVGVFEALRATGAIRTAVVVR